MKFLEMRRASRLPVKPSIWFCRTPPQSMSEEEHKVMMNLKVTRERIDF